MNFGKVQKTRALIKNDFLYRSVEMCIFEIYSKSHFLKTTCSNSKLVSPFQKIIALVRKTISVIGKEEMCIFEFSDIFKTTCSYSSKPVLVRRYSNERRLALRHFLFQLVLYLSASLYIKYNNKIIKLGSKPSPCQEWKNE